MNISNERTRPWKAIVATTTLAANLAGCPAAAGQGERPSSECRPRNVQVVNKMGQLITEALSSNQNPSDAELQAKFGVEVLRLGRQIKQARQMDDPAKTVDYVDGVTRAELGFSTSADLADQDSAGREAVYLLEAANGLPARIEDAVDLQAVKVNDPALEAANKAGLYEAGVLVLAPSYGIHHPLSHELGHALSHKQLLARSSVEGQECRDSEYLALDPTLGTASTEWARRYNEDYANKFRMLAQAAIDCPAVKDLRSAEAKKLALVAADIEADAPGVGQYMASRSAHRCD